MILSCGVGVVVVVAVAVVLVGADPGFFLGGKGGWGGGGVPLRNGAAHW